MASRTGGFKTPRRHSKPFGESRRLNAFNCNGLVRDFAPPATRINPIAVITRMRIRWGLTTETQRHGLLSYDFKAVSAVPPWLTLFGRTQLLAALSRSSGTRSEVRAKPRRLIQSISSKRNLLASRYSGVDSRATHLR